MTLVTVIGRGHSGTRAMSHTLYASGVFMGSCLNPSGDLIPPEKLYDACRVIAGHVHWLDGLSWDFSKLHTMKIPDEFTHLVTGYLRDVLDEDQRHPERLSGWKIPETTLAYPWVVRMFPDAKYIYWIRDPRDSILAPHKTDDLRDFGVPYPPTEDIRLRRAISWKYQFDIVRSTPKPANWIQVRFEDFVLHHERELARLERFLRVPLARIVVRPDSVGRWKQDTQRHDFDFFDPALSKFRYLS
jgi:hypothetical protein